MLRQRLEAACDHVSAQRNVELVQALAAEIPHNIVSIQSGHELASFTCLVHTLGFTGQAGYAAVATLPGHNVFAGKAFASWLLTSGSLTELNAAGAGNDSIVMYSDHNGEFTHVGLLRPQSRVQSKWGTLGLYEHGLYEVPANYGDAVRYFQSLPYDQAIDLFYDFAEENGIEFE